MICSSFSCSSWRQELFLVCFQEQYQSSSRWSRQAPEQLYHLLSPDDLQSQTLLASQSSRLTPNLHPCTHKDVNPRDAERQEHLSLGVVCYFCGRQHSLWLLHDRMESTQHRGSHRLLQKKKPLWKVVSLCLLSALQLRKNKGALAVKVAGSFYYKRRCFMPRSFWTGT